MQTTDNQNELFIEVDESDHVIGSVTRGKAHSDRLLIHRGVWVLVFNDKEELFMQRRSLTKDRNPGMWTLSVGGHVTQGQTYAEAAFREGVEELGIELKLLFISKYWFTGEREQEISCIYKTHHNGPFILHPQEISEGRFFPLKKLEDLIYGSKIEVSNWALAILQKVCGIIPRRKDLKQLIVKEF